MEVIAGCTHAVFPVAHGSGPGPVHEHALACAQALAFEDDAVRRLERVVTELEDNLARNARNGRLLVGSRALQGDVEVISIDEGMVLAGGPAGLMAPPASGLSAVRQIADTFDCHASGDRGLVVLARVQRQGAAPAAPSEFSVGAVCVPVAGEVVCGDAWIFAHEGTDARLMLVDGLGHGPGAAQAASEAMHSFRANPMATARQQLQAAHRRLASTRGAALSVFALDAQQATVRLSGAGNVLGRVMSGVTDKSLMPQSGTAGVRMRTPEEATTPWPLHSVLIAFSDGIVSRWDATPLHPLLVLEPTLLAAVLLRDHCRGSDDATVVVVRRTN